MFRQCLTPPEGLSYCKPTKVWAGAESAPAIAVCAERTDGSALGLEIAHTNQRRYVATPHPPNNDPTTRQPCGIGVDDWAKRQGRVYSTLLVGLERHLCHCAPLGVALLETQRSTGRRKSVCDGLVSSVLADEKQDECHDRNDDIDQHFQTVWLYDIRGHILTQPRNWNRLTISINMRLSRTRPVCSAILTASHGSDTT